MPAALIAANVAVALTTKDIYFPMGAPRQAFPTITFGAGDGSLTYPANGVPLPDKSKFGMKKAIKRIFISGAPALGYLYKYDAANNSIRIYQSAGVLGALVELGAVAVVVIALDLMVLGY